MITFWSYWPEVGQQLTWVDENDGDLIWEGGHSGAVDLKSGELYHFCSGAYECRLNYSPRLSAPWDEAKFPLREKNVREVWQIKDGITGNLNIPDGYGACFGLLRTEEGSGTRTFHLGLWAAKLGTSCEVGTVRSPYWLFMAIVVNAGASPEAVSYLYVEPPGPPALSGVVIGYFSVPTHAQPTLTELCTGQYKSVCTADLLHSSFVPAPSKGK